MFEFVSHESYVVTGRGVVYSVPNPHECDNFDHLMTDVLMNGEVRRVVGVERFMHLPPFRAGEHIGLLFDDGKHPATRP